MSIKTNTDTLFPLGYAKCGERRRRKQFCGWDMVPKVGKRAVRNRTNEMRKNDNRGLGLEQQEMKEWDYDNNI